LVDIKDVDTLNSELESRLDDLFGENDIPLPDSQDQDLTDPYPLAELKNLILSIDWEITDEVLEKFIQQLKDLKLTYKHDKIVLTFLQILNSLGDYIKTNRARSHPKTFKILNSVFSSLDKVVLSGDMAEMDRKKFLRAEMNRYKELRTQILQSKTAVQDKAKARSANTEKPRTKKKEEDSGIAATEPSVLPSDAAKEELSVTDHIQEPSVTTLADAVEEIKQYIHAEIKVLKEEIQSLRNQ